MDGNIDQRRSSVLSQEGTQLAELVVRRWNVLGEEMEA